jgi:hypothetical protein
MSLDARTRSSLYRKLVPILGDDDANALMTQFPSVEADELVTKQFLRAEIETMKGEMHKQHNRLLAEMSAVVAVATAFLHVAG